MTLRILIVHIRSKVIQYKHHLWNWNFVTIVTLMMFSTRILTCSNNNHLSFSFNWYMIFNQFSIHQLKTTFKWKWFICMHNNINNQQEKAFHIHLKYFIDTPLEKNPSASTTKKMKWNLSERISSNSQKSKRIFGMLRNLLNSAIFGFRREDRPSPGGDFSWR